MAEHTIDIRELYETLSSRLEEVRAGETLIITDQGEPVARLYPASFDVQERIQRMLEAGTATWSGRKPSLDGPRVPLQGSRLVSDLLTADRR
jgi:antitoxin (DNA-binding transcriptional repressor) of toxin-antitoxin stability system